VNPEQIDLLEQVLDQTASEATLKRLLELLSTDREFREEFLDALRMNGLLEATMGPDASCERLADVVAVAIPSGGRALDSRVMAQIRDQGLKPALRARRRMPFRIAIAAAACVVGIGAWALFREPAPSLTLVAAGDGVVIEHGADRIPAAAPGALRDGDTVAVGKSGWAWIRYADGTTLQVSADSSVTLEGSRRSDGKRVKIQHGVVFADVAPQPPDRPMVLASPHAKTTVLGTSFSLAVGRDSTKLLVRQGKVTFARTEDTAAIAVQGGQAATAAHEKPLVAEPIRSELLRRLGRDHFMLGIMSGLGEKWVDETRAQGCRWDLRYQHLGGNWTQWNAGGAFVSMYLQESERLGVLPVFTYYGMIRSTPGRQEAGGVAAEIARNCRDRAMMRRYFEDVRLLMQKAGAHGKPLILHVEPGVWSQFLASEGFRPNVLEEIRVAVRATGLPELGGLDDTAASFGKAFGVLRDRFAPNVLLAWHVSKVDGFTPQVAAESLLRCGAWELLFTDVGDRDAGFKEARGVSDAWWKEKDFTEFRDWGRQVYARTGLPLMVWRIPLGNTVMASCNNTPWHYMDNRVEYWLEDYPSNRHVAEWAEAGFLGLLFGGGTIDCTVHLDNAKDGVTNPPPAEGNKGEQATFPDDDGGYLRLRSGRYYRAGPFPFRTD
jgi:hypothetical protein